MLYTENKKKLSNEVNIAIAHYNANKFKVTTFIDDK